MYIPRNRKGHSDLKARNLSRPDVREIKGQIAEVAYAGTSVNGNNHYDVAFRVYGESLAAGFPLLLRTKTDSMAGIDVRNHEGKGIVTLLLTRAGRIYDVRQPS